jgi:hypothetical protein
MSSKKQKHNNHHDKKSTLKQDILTLEQQQAQKLLPLTIIDTAPTFINGVDFIERVIYFTPKVAVQGDEITEEQAENIPEDELYERFRLERSVVVYGTPVTYNDDILRAIFGQFGEVESCFFFPTRDQLSRIAEVTLVDDDAYNNVLSNHLNTRVEIDSNAIRQGLEQVNPSQQLGSQKWMSEYTQQRPDFSSLQKQVDMFFMAIDRRVSDQKKASKRPIIDEDGFQLVVGDERTVEESQKKWKQQQKQKEKKEKVKQKERLTDQLSMYKVHEVQQSRREHQAQQRQNYADKKIINKLKEQRSFNPF